MKLAIIIPGFVPVPDVCGGAIERLITYLVQQNDIDKNFDIDLYTIDHKLLDNYHFKNTKVIKIKVPKLNKFIDRVINHLYYKFNIEKSVNYYGYKTSKMLNKNKYDYILIENNMYIYKDIYNKYKYKNTKFLFHLHNDIGGLDKPESLCKLIGKTAHIVFTCSQFLKKKFEKISGTNNIKTLYNVVDKKLLHFDSKSRKEIREKYNIKNEFVFGYIGRISKEKGTLELVKAFNSMKKNEKVKLMIVGDGFFGNSNNPYYSNLLNEVNKCSDCVVYTGAVDNKEIFKYMSAIDCIVVPTICEEAFGIVAAESLLCKCLVIATKSGGMTEILNENNSYLINKENIIEELSYMMTEVIDNAKENKKKIEFGYSEIQKVENFDLINYYKNFIKILDEEKNYGKS